MSTDVSDPPAAETPKLSIPWWTRGDTNAFFGLGFNILVNVLTLTGLMIGVVKVPADDVLGTILPAVTCSVQSTLLTGALPSSDPWPGGIPQMIGSGDDFGPPPLPRDL